MQDVNGDDGYLEQKWVKGLGLVKETMALCQAHPNICLFAVLILFSQIAQTQASNLKNNQKRAAVIDSYVLLGCWL